MEGHEDVKNVRSSATEATAVPAGPEADGNAATSTLYKRIASLSPIQAYTSVSPFPCIISRRPGARVEPVWGIVHPKLRPPISKGSLARLSGRLRIEEERRRRGAVASRPPRRRPARPLRLPLRPSSATPEPPPPPCPDARLSLLSKRAAAVASAASKRAETAPAVPAAAEAAAWSAAERQGERGTPPKRSADPGTPEGERPPSPKHCEGYLFGGGGGGGALASRPAAESPARSSAGAAAAAASAGGSGAARSEGSSGGTGPSEGGAGAPPEQPRPHHVGQQLAPLRRGSFPFRFAPCGALRPDPRADAVAAIACAPPPELPPPPAQLPAPPDASAPAPAAPLDPTAPPRPPAPPPPTGPGARAAWKLEYPGEPFSDARSFPDEPALFRGFAELVRGMDPDVLPGHALERRENGHGVDHATGVHVSGRHVLNVTPSRRGCGDAAPRGRPPTPWRGARPRAAGPLAPRPLLRAAGAGNAPPSSRLHLKLPQRPAILPSSKAVDLFSRLHLKLPDPAAPLARAFGSDFFAALARGPQVLSLTAN
eukprot:tig00000449_g930.t1